MYEKFELKGMLEDIKKDEAAGKSHRTLVTQNVIDDIIRSKNKTPKKKSK